MAPSYANIFKGIFEQDLLADCDTKPDVWLRFIDDIFVVWTAGPKKFEEFMSFLNSRHPTLKFTFDNSLERVNFLDVTVSRDSMGLISTDLYSKPTDTHQYLSSLSCHPNHIKRSIAFSQSLRILRICSDPSTARLRCNELCDFLVRRGYNRKKVSCQIDRAFKSFYSKSTIPPSVEGEKPRRIYFTVQYHPGLPDIKGTLTKYLPLLHLSSRMREAVPEPPIVSFRQPSNLKNLLVRAKVKNPRPKGEPSRPCYRGKTKPCQLCSKLVASDVVTSTSNRRNFHCFNENTTCSSKWVIYLISCPVCFKQYVGQTNDLRLRINGHKSNLKKFREGKALSRNCTELYKHLSSHPPIDIFCPDS
ncbi:hypothetical protein HOLleu_29652 [Holothuria leucospilota]|uniref:GIY-YIG domain-containing protein n=1 Tax=Holothuria leucospilota TaxID=206669 RepID=A0A9Q1H2S7_HOLLE|nr:hypothetical protein HOLleu_29652 [Holothuria leucospilota]